MTRTAAGPGSPGSAGWSFLKAGTSPSKQSEDPPPRFALFPPSYQKSCSGTTAHTKGITKLLLTCPHFQTRNKSLILSIPGVEESDVKGLFLASKPTELGYNPFLSCSWLHVKL